MDIMDKLRSFNIKDRLSLRMLRNMPPMPNGKSVACILGVVALCSVGVILVVDNHVRVKRHDHELQSLRNAMKQNSMALKARMKRDVSPKNLNTKDGLHIAKRELGDDPEEEEITSVSYGVSYTRWGRHDCKGSGRVVYKGIAAGPYYAHTGGGANMLCLFQHADYEEGKFIEGNQGASHLYGVEFRDSTWISPLFNLTDTENKKLQYHSLPCAVCEVLRKVNKIMIPGSDKCPRYWHKEYKGYIMAGGHSDKHSSQYICVDETPQVVAGTQRAENSAFLYMVETQCASLQCEPIVAGREVRCVVCTI